MQWTRYDKIEFRKALLFVYRGHSALKMFLAESAELALPEIVAPEALSIACFELLEYAESRCLLKDLYCKFCQENPRYDLEAAIAAHRLADALKLDDFEAPVDRGLTIALETILKDFNLFPDCGTLRERLVLCNRDRPVISGWESRRCR